MEPSQIPIEESKTPIGGAGVELTSTPLSGNFDRSFNNLSNAIPDVTTESNK